MKFLKLLTLSVFLVLSYACCKQETNPEPSVFAQLEGVSVTGADNNPSFSKLFVLNEGKFGENNSTIDVFNPGDGKYYSNVYSVVNPTLTLGLGDTGNDIAVDGDKVWVVLNGSSLVEIFSVHTFKHIATVEVPQPRQLVCDEKYVYVSSWNGEQTGNSLTKGSVYRINKNTLNVESFVSVGYYPEGLAMYNGKLFVANSGANKPGLNENTISVIDLDKFMKINDFSVAANIQKIFINESGKGLAQSFGNYYDVHSGVYMFDANTLTASGKIENVFASSISRSGNRIFALGTKDEFSFTLPMKNYSITELDYNGKVVNTVSFDSDYTPATFASDGSKYYFGYYSKDYVSPGHISVYDSNMSLLWNTGAGLNPAHFAFVTK